MPGNSTIACSVFNDGYSDLSTPSDAIYFAGPQTPCIPDGTPSGLYRRWFGRCVSTSDNVAVTFKAFDDGDSNATMSSDAVYNQAPNVVCIPDGTPAGNCRRWFGMPRTVDGRTAECYLFDDGFTNPIGPTHAIYYLGPGQVCMPDGSATGACRKWFGHCRVNNQGGTRASPVRLEVPAAPEPRVMAADTKHGTCPPAHGASVRNAWTRGGVSEPCSTC
jgi:ribosomal protein S14